MARAFLGLGSNVGDRRGHLRAAVAGLPVLVRLDGNGAVEGRQIVDAAALPGVRAAASVWQAVQQAVAAAAARGAEGV